MPAVEEDRRRWPRWRRFSGPLEIYAYPWDDRVRLPFQRKLGPPYRLTPQQVRKLILDTEDYLAWQDREPSEYAIQVHDCRDLLAQIRSGDRVEPWAEGEMPPPASDDSFAAFYRRNHGLWRSVHGGILTEKQIAAAKRRRETTSAHQAKLQAEWEAAQKKRQQDRQAAAQRQWDAENARRLRETVENNQRAEAEAVAQRRREMAAEEAARAATAAAEAANMAQAREHYQRFWFRLSVGFVAQDAIWIRTNGAAFGLKSPGFDVTFEANTTYLVPQSVADLLIRDGRAVAMMRDRR